MNIARHLTETSNYRPEVTNAAQTAALYFMSEEFMGLAVPTLRESGFTQRGMFKYSAGIFCLGQALELTYKSLLRRDDITYPFSHNFAELFNLMNQSVRIDVASIVIGAGWGSCNEFHCHMNEVVDSVNRKYYEAHSSLDLWTHDQSGQNTGHKLWPQLIGLCKGLHQYAASMIWIYPTLPMDEQWS